MENSASATDSLVTFLLSLQNWQPITVFSVFFLTLARILPLLVIVPFLGAKNIPRVVRMMFAVALCLIFLPQNLLIVKQEIPYDLTFIAYMIKELLIGACLGLFAAAPFFIAQTAGTLIDHSRGSSSLQVTDPTTQSQTGPIGVLYNYMLLAIFFTLDGPFLFFNALADSYQLIPVDGLLHMSFFNAQLPFWKLVFTLLQKIMDLSLQIAAPSLIGILLTDLFLGIANRLAPQVQIVFLGISLKSWVGIALMAASWTLALKVLGSDAINWIKSIQKFVTHASYSVAP